MPQPLSKVCPGCGYSFEWDAISKRPKLAPLVMQAIATWSYTDALLARCVTGFLHADFEVVTAMLQALSGSESRRAATLAAASTALASNPERLRLFRAVLKAIKASRDRRNDFAHHQWGIADRLPDSLLLIDPKHFANWEAANKGGGFQLLADEVTDTGSIMTAAVPDPGIDDAKIQVYDQRDLNGDVKDAKTAYGYVHALTLFVIRDHLAADDMQRWLYQQPRIQQALQQTSNGREL